jgi:hypothetical protein
MEMANSGEKKNAHRRGKKEVMNIKLYEVKWRFLTILRAISNSDRYA